ncbi:Proteasome subunit alpha type-2 [Populus alba x Populus x berolinensis]|nr:Proteasome subunit alpha type-2 [Populus alba x Populus x berolinensis]
MVNRSLHTYRSPVLNPSVILSEKSPAKTSTSATCPFFINFELSVALQPPSDLEYLSISSYGGLDLPNWMMTLTRLQALDLHDCTKLEVLPPLGRLPNLESLVLRLMKVRRLDGGFLGIEKDENASINKGEIARVTAFPKLKTLTIWNLEEACRRVGWN